MLPRWDNLIGEKVSTTTNHILVKSVSAAVKAFIKQSAQFLINDGYISSKGDILDTGSTSEWVDKFSSLPDKPVEGIADLDGWIDNSGHVLRAKRDFLNKPTAKKKTHLS
jgi:hypothetical protein